MNNSIPPRRRPDAWPNGFGQGRWPQQFVDCYQTEPAPLHTEPGLLRVDTAAGDCGAAHAAGGYVDDEDAGQAMGDGAGVLLWPMAVIAACACWALFAFLTSSPL